MSNENKMSYKTKRIIAFGIGVLVAIVIAIIIIISVVAHQTTTVPTPTSIQMQEANQANQQYADSKIDAMGSNSTSGTSDTTTNNNNNNNNNNNSNAQSQLSASTVNQIMQTAFSGGQISQQQYDSLNSAQKQDFNSSEAIVRHLNTGESYNSAYISNPSNNN